MAKGHTGMGSKNFIDFMLDTQKKPDLLQGFLAAQTVSDLEELFDPDYKGIVTDDLEKLIQIKAGVLGSGLPGIVQY